MADESDPSVPSRIIRTGSAQGIHLLQLKKSLLAARERTQLLTTRRALIATAVAVGGASWLVAHRAALSRYDTYQPILDLGDSLGRRLQRAAMLNGRLAREYRPDQLSPDHPSNGGFGSGYEDPNPRYDRLAAGGFRDWRLKVEGLVGKPSSVRLDELRSMPSRTQITMHSCDEGWSAIGQWTGVPLSTLLHLIGILPAARYVVFHAMDSIAGQTLFDSIDLYDAFHPQTILAYQFNGSTLPIKYGAPLRLRLELQIGYKNVKHLERIEVVDSLAKIGGGRGGYYQRQGYQWYAGQ